MKNRCLWQALNVAVLVIAVNFFSSCSTGGNPSEEGYTSISGTLAGGAGEILRSGPGADAPSAAPLANHRLYCVTVQEPLVEGSGVADASGNVTAILQVKSGQIACSVLDPQGKRIAKLIFSDASGTSQSQAISGGGDINLSTITVNPATGEAHAKIPDKVTIVPVILPETTITSKPSNPTSSQSAEFQFNSDQASCTFECKLDAGGWEACASPKNYTGLAVTSHTFQVRAKNASGYIEPTPASYTWTIVLHDSWLPTSTNNAPLGRIGHIAFWTGTEMIVWGGFDGSLFFNTGGRYNSSTDSWLATSVTNAPSARSAHVAVWTGTQIIIWGGSDGSSRLNSGGMYNPSTNSWSETSGTNAPSPRSEHTAVWAGNKMVVWGGDNGADYFNTGGIYNPSTDSWIGTSTTNTPSPRYSHSAVSTGNEMVVWGGVDGSFTNTGGKYNPSSDTWITTSTVNAPLGRFNHTAVWTGTEMIVWGGGYLDISFHALNSGGRYNPSTDLWSATSTGTNCPLSRHLHAAVWTGTEMIVWGGEYTFLNNYGNGSKYNPSTNSWIITSNINSPSARRCTTAVWTGTEMILWGGNDAFYFNTGGRYVP